jgi:short-subunit dehydrogenase
MRTDTVLVTGASSGIGLHLAHEFASHGCEMILVARQEDELRDLTKDFAKQYGRMARFIAIDLEDPDAPKRIVEQLGVQGASIDILVNNAGHGFRSEWWELPIEKDMAMVNLNINLALRLTKLLLQPMIVNGRGRILNTASVAGFEAGPMMAVYHATKAFILSWSEALAIELEPRGITVTALCPGATDTDFFPKAGMTETAAFQSSNVMSPQDVAKVGYEGLMNGELFVIPGAINKTMVAARRILPEKTQATINEKLYAIVPPEKRKRQRGDLEFQKKS